VDSTRTSCTKIVEFFSRDGIQLGDKRSLERQIVKITRIPLAALRGDGPFKLSIEERFLWIKERQTTKGSSIASASRPYRFQVKAR
jgi:hypothetical protein